MLNHTGDIEWHREHKKHASYWSDAGVGRSFGIHFWQKNKSTRSKGSRWMCVFGFERRSHVIARASNLLCKWATCFEEEAGFCNNYEPSTREEIPTSLWPVLDFSNLILVVGVLRPPHCEAPKIHTGSLPEITEGNRRGPTLPRLPRRKNITFLKLDFEYFWEHKGVLWSPPHAPPPCGKTSVKWIVKFSKITKSDCTTVIFHPQKLQTWSTSCSKQMR